MGNAGTRLYNSLHGGKNPRLAIFAGKSRKPWGPANIQPSSARVETTEPEGSPRLRMTKPPIIFTTAALTSRNITPLAARQAL